MTMKNYEQFKQELKSAMLEFTDEQAMIAWACIDSDEWEAVAEIENNYGDNEDFTLSHDVSVVSLLNDLKYNGFNEALIVTMITAMHGDCIDLMHCKNDNVYVMAIGAR